MVHPELVLLFKLHEKLLEILALAQRLKGQHRFYAGIDLHASFMHVWVLDAAGNVV